MKNKKDLIAQISENLAVTPAAVPAKPRSQPPRSRSPKEPSVSKTVARATDHQPPSTEDRSSPSTNTGKQAAFWLDDEDRAIFHETGMLLYSQGIKPSHNLILRAAIRMIPRDHRLVEKVRELIEKDGRKVRHQKNDPTG